MVNGAEDQLINLLLNFINMNCTRFESSLRGVNGFTGRGDIAFAVWPNGKRQLNVELRGVAGRVAEVYADGALAATIESGVRPNICRASFPTAVPCPRTRRVPFCRATTDGASDSGGGIDSTALRLTV